MQMKHLAAKLEQLCMEHEDLSLYKAGLPGFEANFTRDSIISGWLFENPLMVRDQLIFSAAHQGAAADPVSGEELGKIHHEMNLSTHRGVTLDQYEGMNYERGLVTTYNACDTTALFLIGHDLLFQQTGTVALMRQQKQHILAAVQYILEHVNSDGLFVERPPEGAHRFALKVTYWKDSALVDKDVTTYPAIYPLAHAQNLQGLRSAQRLFQKMHNVLSDDERDIVAQSFDTMHAMRRGLDALYDEHTGGFYIAIDDLDGKRDAIEGVSSDSLYALAYLEEGDLPKERVRRIARMSKALKTEIGYRGLDPTLDAGVKDSYHSNKVWPVEQAVIHQGAVRFGLQEVIDTAARIRKRFAEEDVTHTDFEIYRQDGKRWVPDGQPNQLWTIAAKVYFERRS